VLPLFAAAQTDVIELKKGGLTEKTYATGMEISMETIYQQWFDGTITAIRHDSIFVNNFPFHYKEIMTLRKERKTFNYPVDGALLMVAGTGVLVLGAVNGLYRKDNANQWFTTGSYITAGAFLVGGFLLIKARFKKYSLDKRFRLEYMTLSNK
jgi:hypothetical protein